MTRFLIKYTDPETGEPAEHVGDYEDSPDIKVAGPRGRITMTITAREWAEDHAYMLSDKSSLYTIKELR